MNAFQDVLSAWEEAMIKFSNLKWIKRLSNGDITINHYKALLRETYYNVSINPQILASSALYYKNIPKDLLRKFYQHSISEIGHDLDALNDLIALGEDISDLPNKRGLPTTIALSAYPLYEMQYTSPLAILGYVFHLEFLPSQNGKKYLEYLKSVGVPDDALTFIKEHSEVDIQHNKFMEWYLTEVIKTKNDMDIVIYATQATCVLHGQMISEAFESVENQNEVVFNRDLRTVASQVRNVCVKNSAGMG